jgi:hypothetical protein
MTMKTQAFSKVSRASRSAFCLAAALLLATLEADSAASQARVQKVSGA